MIVPIPSNKRFDPIFEIRRRTKADITLKVANVRARLGDIAGLHRYEILDGPQPGSASSTPTTREISTERSLPTLEIFQGALLAAGSVSSIHF
jgi:hypothetical protein